MKVLFVTPWFPYPPVNGSKNRIYHLLKSLAENNELHLISFVREGEIVDESGLHDICQDIQCVQFREFSPGSWKALMGFFSSKPRSIIDTYNPEFQKKIDETIEKQKPQVIIFSEIITACYVPSKCNIPCIFEDVEIGVIKPRFKDISNPLSRFRKLLTWRKFQSYLFKLTNQFHLCTVVSEIEKENLVNIISVKKPIEVIPNGVEIITELKKPPEPIIYQLLYNGALTYSANYDAVNYFVTEILDLIHEQVPNAFLTVTGSTKNVDISKLEQNKYLHLTGFVDDIQPILSSSRACIVPLRIGGGTRLKILEAMASGVPVVSTSIGAEGLHVTPEQNILLGDSPEEFAKQTVRILMDPDLHQRLATEGRKLVIDKYDWKMIGKQFSQLVERMGD